LEASADLAAYDETDEKTLRDLNNLRQIIKEGIEKANNILNEARNFESVQALLQELKDTRQYLGEAQEQLQQIWPQTNEALSQVTAAKLDIFKQVEESQRQIEQLSTCIDNSRQALAEITRQEGLNELRQELQNARNGLSVAQTQLQEVQRRSQEQVEVINQGVTRAEAVRLDTARLAQHNRLQVGKVQQLRGSINQRVTDLEQICNQVLSTVAAIGGQESMEALRHELQTISIRLTEAQAQLQEADERLRTSERELQERSVVLEGLASQVQSDTSTVSQLAQQVENGTTEVLRVQSALEQLRQNVVYTLQQTEQRIENQCNAFERQLQERSVTLEGFVYQIESDRTTVSELAQETQERTATILQVQSELEQLRQNTVLTLQQTQRQIENRCAYFNDYLQERAELLEEVASQVQADKASTSELAHKTEEETAKVIQVQSNLEELRQDILYNLQQVKEQIKEHSHTFDRQIQERTVALLGLASQVESHQAAVSQLAQETQQRSATILGVQSQLEHFRENLLFTLEQRESQIETQCSIFDRQIQERTVALLGLASQVEGAQTTVSQLAKDTEDRSATVLQAQSELEQLRQDVLSAVNQLGGKKGLENLLQQYQNIHNTLTEAQTSSHKLNTEANSRSQWLNLDRSNLLQALTRWG
jgi:chromosome segregation ATPase